METTKPARRPSVISAETAAGSGGLSLRTFRLADIAAEAERLLETARAEAAAILAEAKARSHAEAATRCQVEFEEARTQGHAQGYAAGLERGREEGRAQALAEARQEFAEKHAHLVSACTRLMEEINQQRSQWLRTAREDLVELAITLANRVVHCIGERDRQVVLANLEELVRLVGSRTDVTIAVHPVDAAAARTFADALFDAREQWQHIQVLEEPEITPGGCRVRWGTGEADARLDTQLERIVSELKGLSG